jgi:hypothetical protein
VGQSGSNHWKSHRAQILNIEFNPYFDDNDNDRDAAPSIPDMILSRNFAVFTE